MDDHEKTVTILVVDDNDSTRYLLSRTLKKAGFTVIEASDGEGALRLVQKKPDLVTLDVHLPDISGIDVCQRIKAKQDLQSIPVIHISATFIQSKDKVNALESGADGYLTQPLEDVVLIATVKAFLRAKKAEKEREELLEQSRMDVEALQLERQLREQFVSTLSHDLLTPMTAVKMSAQMILRQSDISATTQKLAARVLDSINRADQMVRDLLDVNRIRAGEKFPLDVRECDLREIAEQTLDDLRSTHGDRFILYSPSNVVGSWDRDAIRRTIENLTVNAIKYGSNRPVTVAIVERSWHVEISVHNEGNPLSQSDQTDLFKPYVRTASAQQSGRKGWGLGLTLVRGMTEAHGGTVTIKSSLEAGTTFTVNLPRSIKNLSQLAR